MIRPYLEDTRRFMIQTDHRSFKCILNLADATGRMPHWRLRLSEIEFYLDHRPSIQNQAFDALSCL